jgi:hypothetical protein
MKKSGAAWSRAGMSWLAGQTGTHEFLPFITFEAFLARFLVASLHLLLLSGFTALG